MPGVQTISHDQILTKLGDGGMGVDGRRHTLSDLLWMD
jgi:hypothetical protein